ncbi:MAG: transglutaminase-like domain-containing protein [Planctomycetota bacterium]
MAKSTIKRRIDQRLEQNIPVAGLDLIQALNRIEVADVGVDFLYDNYTISKVFYKTGSRPKLEQIAARVTENCTGELEKVWALARFIPQELPWAGVFTKKTGRALPSDRNMTEEQLLESGFAWCNEQARVFCALTQIIGIPSRLIFASSNAGWGHVTSEVLLASGWMLVDQTMGFCFEKQGKPVRATDVYHDEQIRSYFAQPYKQALLAVRDKIAESSNAGLLIAENPIDCFINIAVHNHFIF